MMKVKITQKKKKKTLSMWELPIVFKKNIMNQILGASEGNHLDAILCNMLSDDPV